MPANSQNQLEEFENKRHPVMSAYYDLRDNPPEDELFKKELWRLIDQDPSFLDPYLTLAELVMDDGKPQEAYFIVREAYDRALSLIGGKQGKWPKRISWGWLENRHILRAINQYAHVVWEEGKANEALEVFRKLLKVNPSDNLGARFAILALRLGLGPDWEDALTIKDSPMNGYAMDADRVDKWFQKNSKKFPEEFGRQRRFSE